MLLFLLAIILIFEIIAGNGGRIIFWGVVFLAVAVIIVVRELSKPSDDGAEEKRVSGSGDDKEQYPFDDNDPETWDEEIDWEIDDLKK